MECKLSKGKPWILFCGPTPHLAGPARVAQRAASHIGTLALLKLAQRREIQELGIFKLQDPVGYGVTQAFASGNDATYRALTSAAKAAGAEISRRRTPFCEIVFPVVVLEGDLIACALREDHTISVDEISSGTLLWRNPLVDNPHTIVQLIVESAVEDFARRSLNDTEAFLETSIHEIQNAFAEFREERRPRTYGRHS